MDNLIVHYPKLTSTPSCKLLVIISKQKIKVYESLPRWSARFAALAMLRPELIGLSSQSNSLLHSYSGALPYFSRPYLGNAQSKVPPIRATVHELFNCNGYAGMRFELTSFWLWTRAGTNSSHPAMFKAPCRNRTRVLAHGCAYGKSPTDIRGRIIATCRIA